MMGQVMQILPIWVNLTSILFCLDLDPPLYVVVLTPLLALAVAAVVEEWT